MVRKFLLMLMLALATIAPSRLVAAEVEKPHGEPAAAMKEAAEGEHGERKHEVIEFDAATAVWVLIIFGLLVVILYFTAWKNVLAGLKAREDGIRKNIKDAEEARKKAEATLKEYNTQLATAEARVRDLLSKASVDAEKLATNLRMQAQQESEEIKERASREIDAARKAAVADIYAQAAELSTGIAEKILRRNLNANDQRDLVNQSLEQLQAAGKV